MKVLYLSEWYPSEKDKMAGLFVQKHAQAVAAQGCEVRVNTWWPEADVVQLNVLTLKKGLVAYVLKRVFGIPYIIIEHWTCYLPIVGAYEKMPRWKRAIIEEIAREASGIFPVSNMLIEHMQRCGITNHRWEVMNNVVDDFFYRASHVAGSNTRKRLLYIGCFDEPHKNVKSLLRAVKKVSEHRQDFCLTLVGTGKDWQMCHDYASELSIPDELLRWTGELMPSDVCKEMQNCDFFVFSSRYENAPVVVSECLAMGIPIVTTKSGGTVEMMTEETGVLVEIEDDAALAEAITYMLDHYQDYDKEIIRRQGKKYSFETVGKKLMKIYEELTHS